MANHFSLSACKMIVLILSVFVLMEGNIRTAGYTINDTDTLYNNLIRGYNIYTRGKSNQQDIVYLSVYFHIISVNEFDELSGRFSIVAYFDIYWTDDRMAWDPALYNGVQHIVFPQKNVWRPFIVLANPNEQAKPVGIEFDDDLIRFVSTGEAEWSPKDLFHVTCFADVKYYPYDTQTCTLTFVAWGYYSEFLQFYVMDDIVGTDDYIENGAWEISGSNLEAISYQFDYPVLVVTLNLKRRSFFYLINMILPIAAMGLINIFVFLLPPESGERVGYSITVLLAIAVFQTIASDNLPKSSYPSVSILCIKLLADFLISCLVMMFSIISLRIYHMDPSHPVPNWLSKVTGCLLCCTCCQGQRKRHESTDMNKEEIYYAYNGNDWRSFETAPTRKDDENKMNHITWIKVGRLMDWVFATFSFLAFIGSSVFFGVYITTES